MTPFLYLFYLNRLNFVFKTWTYLPHPVYIFNGIGDPPMADC